MSIPEGFMQDAYEQMVEEVNEELVEKFLANERIKTPARIRKMAWDMIDTSIKNTIKKTTEMFLHDEINKSEYEMMIHIISLALQKIKTMHT